MSQEYVIYKGARMIKGWPEKIEAAQLESTFCIGGIERQRIRYGEESDGWIADRQACRDCGVVKGQFHVPWCAVEICPVCRRQWITCQCDD